MRGALQQHERLAAGIVVLLAFLARLWAAHGTFLNPDEALHFQIANQISWAQAYEASLTTAHPPLLIFVLHFWRGLGTSEVVLRLPSVIAGTAFCWFLFSWMKLVFGRAAAWIGFIFVSFLPPMIALSAEVRQYALLGCFLGISLYLTERAFAESSAVEFALGYGFVCLALFTHYSALWFAAALGAYSLVRLAEIEFPSKLKVVWGTSQAVLLLLCDFLYRTHLTKLVSGAAITTQEWLANSLFHRGRQSLVVFVFARTFGVFQFVFGQLAVGDVAGILYATGVVLLSREKKARALGMFLVLPFILNCGAAVASLYPYGGTRHSLFLVPFALGGVSVALAWVARQHIIRSLALALVVVLLSAIFGRPHRPYMTRADQSTEHMSRAMTFLHQGVVPGSLILTDYQSSLLLGHYLCAQQPIVFDRTIRGYYVFDCAGLRVLSTGPETSIFNPSSFLNQRVFDVLRDRLGVKTGDAICVAQAGWDIGLAGQLRSSSPPFRDLKVDSFGRNIQIFRLWLSALGPAADQASP